MARVKSLILAGEVDRDIIEEIDQLKTETTETRMAVLTAAGAYSPELDGAQKDNISGTYFDYPVCKFNKDTDEYIYYFFNLPPDYQAGNITVKLTWIAPTATSGAVVWNLAVRGVGAGEAWDAALGSTQAKTQTTEDVAGEKNVCTFDPFNPGWAAGDTVIVKISRDADNASDTLAEDAYFIEAVIEYTGK